MMVILKLPIIYLAAVVYWAVKAEPRRSDGAALLVPAEPEPRPGWGRARRSPRRRLGGPHGSRSGGPRGVRRAAAQARR